MGEWGGTTKINEIKIPKWGWRSLMGENQQPLILIERGILTNSLE